MSWLNRTFARFARLDDDCAVYFAKFDPEASPGIHKKIAATLNALQDFGYVTRNWNESSFGERRLRRMIREIAFAPEKYVFIRSLNELDILLLPALLIGRARGKHIIVDVPSPHRIAVKEIWSQKRSVLKRATRIALLIVGGPVSLWPASVLIQHADESWWFSIGNRKRTLKLGNGVDTSSVPARSGAPPWPAPVLCLVAVATVSFWHGYDRAIRAVHDWNNDSRRPYDVFLTIIGEGRDLAALKALAAELDIAHRVEFTGMLDGTQIGRHFAKAHLALSSLGLHRTGLQESAQLKAREYCLAGIPFIGAGRDPDFPDGTPFRMAVSLGEGTADLCDAFRRFGEVRQRVSDEEIRRYGLSRLGFDAQLKQLGIPRRESHTARSVRHEASLDY